MQLHQELASFLNYYFSLGALIFSVVLFAWAVDHLVMRLRYGPYKELRSIYKKVGYHYALPLGFVTSVFGMFLTLFYSEYLGYLPCALCWFQRVCLYPMAFLFGIAWLRKDFGVYRYILGLSAVGITVSLYHQSLQMGYSEIIPCAANAVFVDCAKPSFMEFGFVTFPYWALTLFTFFFLLALTMRMSAKRKTQM
jgi:disulfide bond formation protein DsbB